MLPEAQRCESSSPPRLHVSIATSAADRKDYQFSNAFRIGRSDECEVCFNHQYLSRVHVEVFFDKGQWWVRDLASRNGVYVDGQRVELVGVSPSTILRLGIEGPFVALRVASGEALVAERLAAQASAEPQASSEHRLAAYKERYFGNLPEGEAVGEHTMLVRMAYRQVQTRQRRQYGWIVAVLAGIILAVGGYALHLHRQAESQRLLAQNLFYAMKSLDLDIVNLQRLVLESNHQQGTAEISKYQERRKEMEQSYDRLLSTLHVYDARMTEPARLVLRIARVFGECELGMPQGFITEIEAYIKRWQSSGRLARAIRVANDNRYTSKIVAELLAEGLPPQFFYLALEESDFDQYVSGPMTGRGIAKGIWQFLPETAVKYGLRLGPLVELPRPDPADDRHHFDRETKAAAHYLKDLYSTDAQASGLLVMACYNWGEDRVLPLVRHMPSNPRERNFWRLLAAYRSKIPQETYDYVFYIASAAVIGENPRLFGFDFVNPLLTTTVPAPPP
jgi:membrane-bound lytic murein transglycosylase D